MLSIISPILILLTSTALINRDQIINRALSKYELFVLPSSQYNNAQHLHFQNN